MADAALPGGDGAMDEPRRRLEDPVAARCGANSGLRRRGGKAADERDMASPAIAGMCVERPGRHLGRLLRSEAARTDGAEREKKPGHAARGARHVGSASEEAALRSTARPMALEAPPILGVEHRRRPRAGILLEVVRSPGIVGHERGLGQERGRGTGLTQSSRILLKARGIATRDHRPSGSSVAAPPRPARSVGIRSVRAPDRFTMRLLRLSH
jgi:hypothetical protein